MKITFFGTPEYVVPVLEELKQAGFNIVAAVTQPPKAIGRKQVLTPSPVARWAKAQKIPVVTDATALYSTVANTADVGILAAYGRILPQEVLDMFPFGILNIHPSILPHWRGASPIPAAIASRDKKTGVTIIKLDEQMDHGQIVGRSKEYKIQSTDTKISLQKTLFEEGAKLLISLLLDYLAGKVDLKEQNHGKATYTRLLKKEHGFIPPEYIAAALQGLSLQARWEIPFIRNYNLIPNSYNLDCFIRALTPWPGVYTRLRLTASARQAKSLKILKAHVEDKRLVLDIVQLEGKNPVSWKQFKDGYPHFNLGS